MCLVVNSTLAGRHQYYCKVIAVVSVKRRYDVCTLLTVEL